MTSKFTFSLYLTSIRKILQKICLKTTKKSFSSEWMFENYLCNELLPNCDSNTLDFTAIVEKPLIFTTEQLFQCLVITQSFSFVSNSRASLAFLCIVLSPKKSLPRTKYVIPFEEEHISRTAGDAQLCRGASQQSEEGNDGRFMLVAIMRVKHSTQTDQSMTFRLTEHLFLM